MVMNVRKTIVIGLGSTGIDICNELVDRLEWEFGDVRGLPWIEFLCFETDTNKGLREALKNSFYSLTITEDAWDKYKRHPEHFSEIKLNEWVDTDTLKKLPGNAVQGGAGNIRMVGRLSLFHEPNYKNVRNAIQKKHEALVRLTGKAAIQKFKEFCSSAEEEIEINFTEEGAVRFFVLGTLCGGTCSGASVEFGYLLQDIKKEEDKAFLLVTLPHPGLSRSTVRHAERFKKNAFTALVEMNHYLVRDQCSLEALRGIVFPDGKSVKEANNPYDIIFLAQPDHAGAGSWDLLARQLVDVVYYIAFVPETDPWAKAVDVQTQPEGGQAYGFSTVGVASLEFPVYLIMKGCQCRLLGWTILEWLSQPYPPGGAKEDLDKIGFSWEKMVERCVVTSGDENLGRHLDGLVKEVVDFAKKGNTEKARHRLEQIRDAFQGKSAPSEGVFGRGSVTRCAEEFARDAPEKLRKELERFAGESFLDLRRGFSGFSRMQALLTKLQETFREVGQTSLSSVSAGDVDKWLEGIEDVNHSVLLGILGLRGRVRGRLARSLRSALENELKHRKEKALLDALLKHRDGASHATTQTPLDRLERLRKSVMDRLDNLKRRLGRWSDQLMKEYEKCRDQPPQWKGVFLFEDGKDGTVDKEFKECLQEGELMGATWEEQRERKAQEILKVSELAKELTRDPEPGEKHWLVISDWESSEPLPKQFADRMLKEAANPFRRLERENVLDRWSRDRDKETKARVLLTRHVEPLLQVSPQLTRAGGKSGYNEKAVLLVPWGSREEEFSESVKTVRANFETVKSPQPHRIVAIKFILGFPLKAAEPISGVNGLHSAECTDFPIFHSRKDVRWHEIDVGASEQEKYIRSRIAVALILDIVKIKEGKMVYYLDDLIRGKCVLRFPLSIAQTARLITKGFDEQNQEVGDMIKAVDYAIQADRQKGVEEHIRRVQRGWSEFPGGLVNDWSRVPGLLLRYFKEDEELESTWKRIAKPSENTMKILSGEEGKYKCGCGQDLGSEEEFENENWTCPRCGKYYGGAGEG